MTLEEYINSLSKGKQFNIAIRLTRLALTIWNKYADKNKLAYRDTVVGLHHSVDKNLLKNTINTVEKYISTSKAAIKNTELLPLSKQFSDPIVALQDTDWELPNEVVLTFYAVYNLLNSALGEERKAASETIIYIAINQAIAALESSKLLTEAEIREVLYQNKTGK